MFLILLLVLALSSAAVPHFSVDLDVDPEERWKEVILYFRDLGAIEALTVQPHPHAPPEVQREWMEIVQSQLDEDFEGEIRGWLKYGGLNVTREWLLTFNAKYEMNYPVFCSGLLAAMPNGTVVHGRNLDYVSVPMFIDGKPVGYSDFSVEVTFFRGGQPLMTSVTWPGALGIHTGMRFDGWTFEQNTRRSGGDNLQLNTAAARNGGKVFTLLVRRIMERVPDFETALQELWSANLASPMYFIMAGKGPYEGAVLSMDRGGVHEPSSPPVMRLIEQNDAWHMLQTNDDMTGKSKDPRRPLENWRLALSEQSQVSPEWVFNEMHTDGILREDATVFTWIAVPATGLHRTFLQNETWTLPKESAQVGTSALGSTVLVPPSLEKL